MKKFLAATAVCAVLTASVPAHALVISGWVIAAIVSVIALPGQIACYEFGPCDDRVKQTSELPVYPHRDDVLWGVSMDDMS